MTQNKASPMDELKPCPFCGEQPQTKEWIQRALPAMRIWCDEHSVQVMVQSTKDTAIEAWNTRHEATTPALDAQTLYTSEKHVKETPESLHVAPAVDDAQLVEPQIKDIVGNLLKHSYAHYGHVADTDYGIGEIQEAARKYIAALPTARQGVAYELKLPSGLYNWDADKRQFTKSEVTASPDCIVEVEIAATPNAEPQVDAETMINSLAEIIEKSLLGDKARLGTMHLPEAKAVYEYIAPYLRAPQATAASVREGLWCKQLLKTIREEVFNAWKAAEDDVCDSECFKRIIRLTEESPL